MLVLVIDSGGVDSLIGKRLRGARVQAGLTQAQLAGNQLSQSLISLIERGKVQPSLDTVRILSERLGKPVEYLTGSPTIERWVDSHLQSARSLQAKGLMEEAKSYLQLALEMTEGVSDSSVSVEIRMQLAEMHFQQGEFNEALDQCFMAADSINGENPDDLARCYGRIGSCYFALGELYNARRWTDRTLKIPGQRIRNSEVIYENRMRQGHILFQLRLYELAQESYQVANNAGSSVKDQLEALLGVSKCLRAMASVNEAKRLLYTLRARNRSIHNHRGEMICLLQLSSLLIDEGQIDEAALLLYQCTRFFEHVKDQKNLSSCLEEKMRLDKIQERESLWADFHFYSAASESSLGSG